jgi:UDP-N-acetylglucosamine acyltransferase
VSGIHPTAVVDPAAELGASVEVGPYAVVGPHVRLGEGVVLRPHAYVTGHTELGAGTQVFSFASVGEIPQDLKYRGEKTRLEIGARNVIREHVTISPGTEVAGGVTSIGDDNLLMIGTHVGHDCQIGSHIVMANGVGLAGHVTIEDYAFLAGMAGVHQFVRIGESAMVGGMSGVAQDVCPYSIAQGNHARLLSVNRINLERRGFDGDRIAAVERAFRILFRSGVKSRDAFARVREELPDSAEAEHMVAFLEKSERGFCRVR